MKKSESLTPDLGGGALGSSPPTSKPTRQQQWRKRNPKSYLAHLAVGAALRLGVIEREPCRVCGNPKAEAHHPNYDMPYDVIWLCRKHHKREHKRLKAAK